MNAINVNAITRALVAQARVDIAKAHAADAARPVGQIRLDIDFYSKAERDLPIEDGSLIIGGKLCSWRGSRWAVWRVRWTGSGWVHTKRVSGPLKGVGAALTRLSEEVRITGIPRREQ